MKSRGILGNCVNCWSIDEENIDCRRRGVIRELSIGPPTIQHDQLIVTTMKVKNVLGGIFPQLKYIDDLKYIIDKGKDPLQTNGDDDDDEEEEQQQEIGLCETCSDSLENLLRHFNQFNELRKLNSYLSKKLGKFDNLLRHIHQTGVNCAGDTMDIKSENEEHSDEYFNCTDDNGDVTNSMDWEFQESDDTKLIETAQVGEKVNRIVEHDPTPTRISRSSSVGLKSPFKILILTEKPTTTKTTSSSLSLSTRSILSGPGPVVSIRRLNENEVAAATIRRQPRKSRNKKFKKFKDDDVKIEHFADEDDIGGNEAHSDDDLRGSSAEGISSEEEIGSVKRSTPRRRPTSTSTSSKSAVRKKSNKKRKKSPVTSKNRPPVITKIVDGKCPICFVGYEIPRNLSEHIATHVKDMSSLSCPVPDCSTSFTVRETLLSHIKKHAQDVRHRCPVESCGKIFSKKFKKSTHVRIHCKEGFFVCPKCDAILGSQDLFDRHQESRHPKMEFICPSCDPIKTFETEKQLNFHMTKDHVGEKVYICNQPNCLKTFQLHRHLLTHYAMYHTGDRIHRCPRKCGIKFATEEKLKVHVDRQQCRGEKKFLCNFCPKMLRDIRLFEVHVLSHKGELPTFACPHPGCDKKFYTARLLEKHTPSHSEERPFTCELCGAACKSATTLKHHYLVHDGKKCHLCPHCGKSFLREEGLKKHLRVHSDRKGYKCQECGKEFKYSESCRLHYLTQHKESQFICSICDAGFPYNFSLQKHMANCH